MNCQQALGLFNFKLLLWYKQMMLEILAYLVEHFMGEDWIASEDESMVFNELKQAGFELDEVQRAFKWIEGMKVVQLAHEQFYDLNTRHSTRVLASHEAQKLGLEAQSYLRLLESRRVLDAVTRELVIDRLLALTENTVDASHVKLVTLMVLFNQPKKKAELALLEQTLLHGDEKKAH